MVDVCRWDSAVHISNNALGAFVVWDMLKQAMRLPAFLWVNIPPIRYNILVSHGYLDT